MARTIDDTVTIEINSALNMKSLKTELSALEKQISSEKFAVSIGVKGDEDLKRFESRIIELQKSMSSLTERTLKQAKALRDNIVVQDKMSASINRHLESLKTPMDKVNSKLELTNRLFQDGRLTAEQYSKAVASLTTQLDRLSTKKGIGAGGANIQASGAYSSLATGRTTGDRAYSNYVAQAKSAEQELKASANRVASDQAKAAKEAERAWSKTFMGAIEGGTTFGHKLATTFQYATAGMAYYGLAGGLAAMTQSFLDADKAMHMFRGVLELTDGEAQKLQSTVFSIGTTYGGQLKDLNEAALALGRAGIATKDLGTALKSVSQLSLVSGESLGVVTDVMVSWSTLYPEKKIGDLGDIIVKVANESKASVADFNTMSTYILTAGQQAGLTAEAVASLAGAFKQIGKGSSTSGTEIRRFFQQLESGSDDVRKAYDNLNINMDQLRENLMQGGDIADATMVELFKQLGEVPEKEGQKAIMHIEEVLDKATLKSLLAVAHSGEAGLNEFKRILGKAKEESQGAAEKAASEVALSYSVAFERIKNTAFQEASVFGQAFTSKLFDGASVGEFDKYIKELTADTGLLNKTMHNLGVMLGTVIDNIGKLSVLLLLFKAGSWLQLGIGTTSAGFINMARSIGFVNAGMATLNSLIRANPLLAAGMLGTAIWAASDAVAGYIDSDRRDPGGSANLKSQNAKRVATEKMKDARALTDELARQEIAYKNLSKAASNSSGITAINLKKQAEQAKQNAIDIRKALGYKDSTKSPVIKVPSISGNTILKDTDKGSGKAERNAQQLLDSYREIIKANEQEWFLQAGITDELSKNKHNLEVTLPALRDIAALTIDREKRLGEIAKVNSEISKTTLEIEILERSMAQAGATRLQELKDQQALAQNLSEIEKIKVTEVVKEAQLQRELGDAITSNKYTSEDALTIYKEQLNILQEQTNEKLRQLEVSRKYEVSGYSKKQDRLAEDLKAQTEYEKYRNVLLRESIDIADDFYQKAEAGLEITELDIQKYEDRVKLIDRSSYKMYMGMQLQQTMQSELNSGLSDFFNIQSEGWMNYEKLGMSVLNALMQKMIQISIIEPIAKDGSSWLTSLGGQAVNWFSGLGGGDATNIAIAAGGGENGSWAKGGVSINGNPTYLAKGGYVNSIVKKPTYVANGTIAGEAGAESVMPLKRNSQGQLGVIAQTTSSKGVENIQVQIINQSGEELKTTKSEGKFEGENFILTVVIDAIQRNKSGMRDAVKGAK